MLFDLPETLAAARQLYPAEKDWEGIEVLAGNILTPCIRESQFDLVILSNILHAYGRAEAGAILQYCAGCLAPGGLVLIHDYLADLHDVDPVKGTLYDLHMLINTFNGRIYRLAELLAMLRDAGLKHVRLWHLHSDTSILLANPEGPGLGTRHAARAADRSGPTIRLCLRPDYPSLRDCGGAMGTP